MGTETAQLERKPYPDTQLFELGNGNSEAELRFVDGYTSAHVPERSRVWAGFNATGPTGNSVSESDSVLALSRHVDACVDDDDEYDSDTRRPPTVRAPRWKKRAFTLYTGMILSC